MSAFVTGLRARFSFLPAYLGAAAVLLLIGSAVASRFYADARFLQVWKPFLLTQYQFDYEYEFVKRGLIGEFFRLAGVPRTGAALGAVSLTLMLSAAALVVAAFTSFVGHAKSRPLLIAFLLCPATFLQAGWDLGRLDPWLFVLTLLLLVCVRRPGLAWTFVCVALTLLGVGVHEMFLLAGFPLAMAGLALAALHDPDRRRDCLLRGGALVLTAGLASLIIHWVGNFDTLTSGEFTRIIQARGIVREPNMEAVLVAFRGVSANAEYTRQVLADRFTWRVGLCAAVFAIYLVTALWAARRSWAAVGFVLVATLSPVALLTLGYDYGRWFAFAAQNALVAIAFLQTCSPLPPDELNRLRWLGLLALLGPFGVTVGFPWLGG